MAVAVVAFASAPVGAFDAVDFRVSGGDAALEKTLRESSAVLAAVREKTTDPQDLFAAALAEYGRIVGALYAEGYYSPVVHVLMDGREAALIPPLDAPGSVGRVTVSVETGPPFTFSRARIAPLAPGTRLPPEFAAGNRARSGAVVDSVATAVDGWRDAGHAKAAVAGQSVVADHARASLSAEVAMAPGPRLRFGALKIEGAERMRERRIRKIAGLPEGRVFSPDDLDRSTERLRRTGVFKSVILTEDEVITAPDLLGITANLVEDLPRHLSFGAEVASLDGLTLSGQWVHRNLLGGAERLTLDGEVANIGAQSSGTDYTLGLTLDRPATLDADTTLSFNIDLSHLNEVDYSADIASVGTTFSHVFSERLTGSLGIEYSSGRFTDDTGAFTFRQLALPVGLTWDNRDAPLDATKGYYLNGEVKPFAGFGSTSSGTRVTLDARAYRAFGAARPVVLAGRVQAGVVFGADIARTPRDYLFYSGGGGTVRGQPYQSLGVEVLQAGGEPVQTGGTAFLAGSLELRAKVTDKIGVVGFVDAGQVSALDFNGSGGWHAGAGLGVRYDTGFGPIRLDVAAPVGGDTGSGVQIYVGIGQAF
jgi:translocation and assembly module TamA